MKKMFVFAGIFLALLLMCDTLGAQTTVVRFSVTLPGNGISADSAVYLTGSFNGWKPQDENYRMNRVDGRHYRLDVPCFSNKQYEYKYTLGGWNYVEKTPDNKEIQNRKFISTKKLKIEDEVAAWNVPAPKKEGQQNPLAGMLSPEQIGKLKQLKDSVTKGLGPVVPQLLAILQKVNDNLLAENPDPELRKEYTAEMTAVVGKVLESISDALTQVVAVLTPEQKQKLRDMLKGSNSPDALINLITK